MFACEASMQGGESKVVAKGKGGLLEALAVPFSPSDNPPFSAPRLTLVR